MSNAPTPPDDEMPAQIDFSGGRRGKFYRSGATLNMSVYLRAGVQSRLTRVANGRGRLRVAVKPVNGTL